MFLCWGWDEDPPIIGSRRVSVDAKSAQLEFSSQKGLLPGPMTMMHKKLVHGTIECYLCVVAGGMERPTIVPHRLALGNGMLAMTPSSSSSG